jgi:hypothetical protein
MKEIESNKHTWGQISEEHYAYFKKAFLDGWYGFNKDLFPMSFSLKAFAQNDYLPYYGKIHNEG